MGCAQSTQPAVVEKPKEVVEEVEEIIVLPPAEYCCECCGCAVPKCACDCVCPPTMECMCPCCIPKCTNTCRCYLECCDAPCFGCDSMLLTEKPAPAVVPVTTKKAAPPVKKAVPPVKKAVPVKKAQ